VGDAAVAVAVVAGTFLLLWLVFGVLPDRRIALRPCPRCKAPFGAAVAAAVPYYERLCGRGTRVFGGPRRYLGARVVRCAGCQAEYVFGELGGLVEPFDPCRAQA
jgi:hypothetical protein